MKSALSDRILQKVEKPIRYIGNEWNSVIKCVSKVDIRFAFCFPDVYEVGMSHLGMRILYHMLNDRDDVYCERVFAPWLDMEEQLRANNISLFALETKDPLSVFDFIGFTLQYEMSYTNIVNMLDLSGIPVFSSDRLDTHPLICAGGPCAYNPEPLADIIDFFVIGEGEEILNEVMDLYKKHKKNTSCTFSKERFLGELVCIEGIYVPKFYDVFYNEDNTIKSMIPKHSNYPEKIRKRIIKDLDKVYFPSEIIVPFTEIVHDRVMLELFRGCIRGCRFCQAGFIYRPVREKSYKKLVEKAKTLINATGYEEVSLTSLSTSDYTHLRSLTHELLDDLEPKMVNLSLPSLRIDSFSLELLEKSQKVRKSGLTFAPEAGTQRLRDVINKGITREDILNSASLVFNSGVNGIKLYFMIGLPTETFEDLDGIVNLGNDVVQVYKEVSKDIRKREFKVTISVSSFVPKPFTPFQWEAQDSADVLKQKQLYLKSEIKNKLITYNWHDSKLSFMEAIFARGDRRLSKVLIKAWEKGCRFDGWGEHFKMEKWLEAFSDCNIDPKFYAYRKREYDEVLPWDHIDIGVSKEFFIRESKKAYEEELTANCRKLCSNCGLMSIVGGKCINDN